MHRCRGWSHAGATLGRTRCRRCHGLPWALLPRPLSLAQSRPAPGESWEVDLYSRGMGPRRAARRPAGCMYCERPPPPMPARRPLPFLPLDPLQPTPKFPPPKEEARVAAAVSRGLAGQGRAGRGCDAPRPYTGMQPIGEHLTRVRWKPRLARARGGGGGCDRPGGRTMGAGSVGAPRPALSSAKVASCSSWFQCRGRPKMSFGGLSFGMPRGVPPCCGAVAGTHSHT